MKPKMYSSQSNSMLHDHIIDGLHTTHEGLRRLKEQKLIKQDEYATLLEKNIQRLVQRIQEFRIKEGLVEANRRLTCIFFAIAFAWMQVNGDDLEMRRTRITRTMRAQRSGRRRLEEI
jgi:hypothetical protein